MDKIKLVVYNEYALGYIMPEQPDKVCTLVDRITLGAPFRTMNEPYFIGKNDTVRLASRKDFDTFRVCAFFSKPAANCTEIVYGKQVKP